MGESIEDILKKPQFDVLTPERKVQLVALSQKLSGKSSAQSVAIIGEFVKNMPADSKLTAPEQEAMAEAFVESLPASDRSRVRAMMRMAKGLMTGKNH